MDKIFLVEKTLSIAKGTQGVVSMHLEENFFSDSSNVFIDRNTSTNNSNTMSFAVGKVKGLMKAA